MSAWLKQIRAPGEKDGSFSGAEIDASLERQLDLAGDGPGAKGCGQAEQVGNGTHHPGVKNQYNRSVLS
jgi:hypothetical protein